jgi:CheY-like chemotaxis protein
MQHRVVSVVDDDPSAREGAVDLLNSAGIATESFQNAEEFLRSGKLDWTSCLVADIRMPGLSGIELHEQLRGAGKEIPSVLITGFPTDSDRTRARQAGAWGYLKKPFSEQELLSYVNSALEGKQHVLSGYKHESSDPWATTLFHERWWLAAATNGEYEEATVTSGGRVVGRLPYMISRQMGFLVCRMPPFTHALGPIIEPNVGKPQTALLRRLSIIRDLIDQLPEVAFFKQALALSLADGLAFQDRGFQVTPQYTFEIDCRENLDSIWKAMHFKTRQHIRRAEERLNVSSLSDPRAFTEFYLENIRRKGLRSFIDFTNFPSLFAETQARDSSEILCASWPDGKAAAMVVVVWGHGKMYYLLSTRAGAEGDNGSISLLIWEAIKRAHGRGLVFDLDGVSTSGTARFLSGFGGRLELRLIAQRTNAAYTALRSMKRGLGWGRSGDSSWFT